MKDVGGFVGGTFINDRRKSSYVQGRDILTLDMDNIPAGQTDEILKRVSGLGCAVAVYSTRKHTGYAPRLRVLIPLDRTATSDEYEPAARKAAALIGIEFCDPTTFDASRLMYWPSCCSGRSAALIRSRRQWRNLSLACMRQRIFRGDIHTLVDPQQAGRSCTMTIYSYIPTMQRIHAPDSL